MVVRRATQSNLSFRRMLPKINPPDHTRRILSTDAQMTSTKHFHIEKHTIPTQHIRHYPRATRNPDDELKLAVNQYIPKDNPKPKPGDITILAAHANGVGKELYEPLFDDLHERLKKEKRDLTIRAIWMTDVAWQGESSVLNEKMLGNDPSWFDHPRDLLHLTNIFRHSMPAPIFGIGHSLGGNNMVNLSLMHPSLLSGLILIDPVIQKDFSKAGNLSPTYLSTFRRDVWPSREEAAASFRKNAFYSRYDPRVLDKHIEYNLRELPTETHPDPTPTTSKSQTTESLASASTITASPSPPSPPTSTPVTLRTPKAQEVFTFARPKFPPHSTTYSATALAEFNSRPPPRTTHPDILPVASNEAFYNSAQMLTFKNLPHLRPRVLYVFAKDSYMSGGAPEAVEDKMRDTGIGVGGSRYPGASDPSPADTETAVQQVMIPDAGHFVPFERPDAVAQSVSSWLVDAVGRWRRETEAERRAWDVVKASEGGKGGFVLGEQFREWIRGDAEVAGVAKPRRKESGGGSKL